MVELDETIRSSLSQLGTATKRYAEWYEGIFLAVLCHANPDRFAQAANSARELLEKLPDAVTRPALSQTSMRDLLFRIESRFDDLKTRSPQYVGGAIVDGRLGGGQWVGQIDERLASFLNFLDDRLVDGRPTPNPRQLQRQEAIPLFLGDNPNPSVGSGSLTEIDSKWKKLLAYFTGVVHHRSSTTEAEFYDQLSQTNALLRQIVVSEPLKAVFELDQIIEEGESDAH